MEESGRDLKQREQIIDVGEYAATDRVDLRGNREHLVC
jgi:hypothetical protein